jgi:hypothetical protein
VVQGSLEISEGVVTLDTVRSCVIEYECSSVVYMNKMQLLHTCRGPTALLIFATGEEPGQKPRHSMAMLLY